MNKILEFSEELLRNVVRKQSKDKNIYDDLMQEGRIAVLHAQRSYDSLKGKWEQHVYSYVLRAVRRAHKALRRDTWKEEEYMTVHGDERYTGYFDLLDGLPDIHQQVITYRYGLNGESMTQLEIGQELGLSEGRVSQIHREAIELLRVDI